MGAGHRVGLPRDELRPPDRRAGPPDHRRHAEGLRARRDRANRWAPTSRSARARPTSRGSRRLVAPPPRDRGPERLSPDHPAVRTFAAFPPGAYGVALAETAQWRAADIGGADGHGNARGLVRALRPIALGGAADGVRLLSPATVDLIFAEQSHGTDLVLGIPLRFGIGFGLSSPESVRAVPAGRVCWWGGWGGSLVVMDASVNVPGLGPISGNVAWSGNWFFLVENHGQQLDFANIEKLTDVAWRIRLAVNAQGFPEVDHVELFGPATPGTANSRNFVLCPGGAPTGRLAAPAPAPNSPASRLRGNWPRVKVAAGKHCRQCLSRTLSLVGSGAGNHRANDQRHCPRDG